MLAWFVGPRKSFERGEDDVGHNQSLSLIGAALVWMGWLALIGGSAVSADEDAIIAIVNTQTACAASFCCWMILERSILGHVTPAAFTYGVIIGEVSMMSGAPYISVSDAMIIGSLTSIACFFGRYIRIHGRIDDTFEAFGFYAIGGAVSTVATGFFACVGECVDEDVKGVLDGDLHQLYRQIFGVFVVGAWSASMTLVVAVVISKFIDLRVTQTVCEGTLCFGFPRIFHSWHPVVLRLHRKKRLGWISVCTGRRCSITCHSIMRRRTRTKPSRPHLHPIIGTIGCGCRERGSILRKVPRTVGLVGTRFLKTYGSTAAAVAEWCRNGARSNTSRRRGRDGDGARRSKRISRPQHRNQRPVAIAAWRTGTAWSSTMIALISRKSGSVPYNNGSTVLRIQNHCWDSID